MHAVERQDRIRSALVVAVFHAALGYALIVGLGVDVARIADERLKLFDISEAPPPPPLPEPIPPPETSKAPAERIKPAPKGDEGAAAPPNLKSSPTQIVAPERVIELPVPTPIVAAPIAGPGAQNDAGASDRPGPGTGAGGQGTGLGSGRGGSGAGGGGGGGVARRARWIGGGVRQNDLPCSPDGRCAVGTVYMQLSITREGRAGGCSVTRSSGDAELDRDTCRVLQRRLRFAPARDAWGRRVPDTFPAEQQWYERVAPDRWVEADIPDDE